MVNALKSALLAPKSGMTLLKDVKASENCLLQSVLRHRECGDAEIPQYLWQGLGSQSQRDLCILGDTK
jgi:hypothetical protein